MKYNQLLQKYTTNKTGIPLVDSGVDVLCPECRHVSLLPKTLQCTHCQWKGEQIDDIPIILSEKAKNDPLMNRYVEIYDGIAEDDVEESLMDVDYVKTLAKHTSTILGTDLTGQMGCDVGSGKGFLLNELIGLGANMTAVDIAIPYLKRLKSINEEGLYILANAEELPFREQFDFVTCTDILEHVLNVSNFLYCLNESIKPGGLAVVRVPFDENLLGYATHLGCPYDLVHLRNFDEQSLKNLMVSAGFTIEDIRYGGYSLSMRLPKSCDNDPKLAVEVEKTRAILRDRGCTYDDLANMPEWLISKICRPYELTLLARKTHRILKDENAIYRLAPID